MPKVIRKRPGPSRISSKKYSKYSIKAKAPMKPVKLTKYGKVALAKLDYDIAVEENLQSSIVRDIAAIEQQMVNERNRYQMTKRKYVRGEAQLIGDSQNYSMLKRQQETLQREQQRSTDRLSTMKTNKIVSVSPVKSATKSFRGISNMNPMQSGKSYVPVIPGSSVASPGPLGNLDDTFKDVLGSAQNLIPSLPKAYGSVGTTAFGEILKAGKIAGSTFSRYRKAGKKNMESKIIKKESDKARKAAMEKAAYAGLPLNEIKRAGNEAAKQMEIKMVELLGKEKKVSGSKVAFMEDRVSELKVGDEIGPPTPAEAATSEMMMAEELAKRSKDEGVHIDAMKDFLIGNKKITQPDPQRYMISRKFGRKTKKIGKSGAIGFGPSGDWSRNVSSVGWFDETTAKKMIAAGTVLGSGTFLPLHAAYGDYGPPKAKGFNPVGDVIQFGGDFYKGVQGLFGAKKKRVVHRKKPKKKGKKR